MISTYQWSEKKDVDIVQSIEKYIYIYFIITYKFINCEKMF